MLSFSADFDSPFMMLLFNPFLFDFTRFSVPTLIINQCNWRYASKAAGDFYPHMIELLHLSNQQYLVLCKLTQFLVLLGRIGTERIGLELERFPFPFRMEHAGEIASKGPVQPASSQPLSMPSLDPVLVPEAPGTLENPAPCESISSEGTPAKSQLETDTIPVQSQSSAVQIPPESTAVQIYSESTAVQVRVELFPVQTEPESSLAQVRIPESSPVQSEPESSTIHYQPESSAVQHQRESSLVQSQPESSEVQPQPESSLAQVRPESTFVQDHPESSYAQLHPESSLAHVLLESSLVKLRPKSSTVQPQPESSLVQVPPESSLVQVPPESSLTQVPPESSHVQVHPLSSVVQLQPDCRTGKGVDPQYHAEMCQPECVDYSCAPRPAAPCQFTSADFDGVFESIRLLVGDINGLPGEPITLNYMTREGSTTSTPFLSPLLHPEDFADTGAPPPPPPPVPPPADADADAEPPRYHEMMASQSSARLPLVADESSEYYDLVASQAPATPDAGAAPPPPTSSEPPPPPTSSEPLPPPTSSEPPPPPSSLVDAPDIPEIGCLTFDYFRAIHSWCYVDWSPCIGLWKNYSTYRVVLIIGPR